MSSSAAVIRPLARSLQVRLALGFALTLTVLVGGSGLLLYSSIESIIHAQIHREFTNTARLLVHKLDEDHLPLNKEILDVGDHFRVRVADRKTGVTLETPGMERLYPNLCTPPSAVSWVWTDGPNTLEHSPRTLLVQYRAGYIQIYRDMKPEELLLRSFFHSLMLLLAAAPVLGAGLGYGLVKVGLRPLRYLETEAGNLRPENLKMRIDAARLPSELAPLAKALNQSIARLEGAFQRLGELNSDLAHELRTPVHSLRLEVEGLLAAGDLGGGTEDHLVGMMGTLDHLAALIEQMLFLARWEDPSTQVERERLWVRSLLEATLEPFEPLAEESQIRLELEVDPTLQVFGNAILLRRALHNLLGNAIRHSEAGGTVTLRAFRDARGLHLVVEDRGEGIAPQFLATLGQRFARTDLSRSRKRGGAGLGLAIVHGIARLHGGTLHLESQEGVGTVAQITIPVS